MLNGLGEYVTELYKDDKRVESASLSKKLKLPETLKISDA